jgi:hypothetical protein
MSIPSTTDELQFFPRTGGDLNSRLDIVLTANPEIQPGLLGLMAKLSEVTSVTAPHICCTAAGMCGKLVGRYRPRIERAVQVRGRRGIFPFHYMQFTLKKVTSLFLPPLCVTTGHSENRSWKALS